MHVIPAARYQYWQASNHRGHPLYCCFSNIRSSCTQETPRLSQRVQTTILSNVAWRFFLAAAEIKQGQYEEDSGNEEAYQEDQPWNKEEAQRGKKRSKGDGFEKTKREGRCHEDQDSQGPEESDEDYHPTLDTETQDETWGWNRSLEPAL